MRFLDKLGLQAKKEQKKKLDEIKELDTLIHYTKLACVHENGKIFYFNIWKRLGDFSRSICFDDISLEQAIDKQNEMEYLIRNRKLTN